ncbi:MAG TPA: hypothetical protein VK177_00110 [Flavobacteriales bacterium]|nr:hypothetical protein [Flavobacteriales bacterium]
MNTISNDKIDPLFRLIKSFSKSEKRSFKMLYSKGDGNKKFVQLFDEIEKREEYDEEKLKSNKHFTPGQLPNLKIQLYNKLLDSLRFASNNRTAKKQVAELIDNAHLLYDRCMYADCLRQLDKARVLAHKFDLVTPLVEINELHQQTLRLTLNDKNSLFVDQLLGEMSIVVKRLKQINGFTNLSLQLNSQYAHIGSTRNKEELKKVKDFFTRKISEFDIKQTGIEEQLSYYTATTGFFFFTRNFREAEKYALKWLDLFEKNEELKYHRTESYIKALNSLLVAQNKLFAIDDFTLTHRKLIAIKRDKKFHLNRNLNLQLFKAIYIHEMNRHFILGDFKSGARIVVRHQPEINRILPLLDQNTRFLFCYKIACLHFGASQFRSALSWLNKITMTESTNVREDIQSFARILRLVCYFEMNDDYGVQSNIRSTYRFLLSRKNYGQYENLIIQFLKNLRGNETQSELKNQFIELQKNMMRISKLKYEKRAFIYFDMIVWLESKVQNRDIQDVFKDQVKKGIRYEF